ncbi:MAG: nickel-responsive transcriptional regulator NikR [Thiothrix sp.]|nr:nickel-responsive transcriptional regulator NikR [Thiothrix sp.]HPE60241.1 nickel-responsive transcriptional regulator NikR [Thiolinea sp.]
MQRITISLEDELIAAFEQFMSRHSYQNRSEAIRDLIRDRLESERHQTTPDGKVIGTLTYVYNHHERELASRLTRAHHHHHELSISTLHVHLDRDNCLETVVLSGTAGEVQSFADNTIAQPGIRHGRVYLLPR